MRKTLLLDIISDAYGLDEEDPMATTVDYTTSGTMQLAGVTTSDLSSEELETLEDQMEETLSELLGVSTGDIDLTIDPETGVVSYTISSNNFTETASILEQMKDSTFLRGWQNFFYVDVFFPSIPRRL